MKKSGIFFAVLLISLNFLFPGSFTAQDLGEEDKAEIHSVLLEQNNSWNKGDLVGYMNGYWKSDSLRFIGKNGILFGWDNIFQNYKKSYPGKAQMGRLIFEVISLEKLNEKSAFMIGKWDLEREIGNLSGYFTLIWEKINGSWVITTDHSS